MTSHTLPNKPEQATPGLPWDTLYFLVKEFRAQAYQLTVEHGKNLGTDYLDWVIQRLEYELRKEH